MSSIGGDITNIMKSRNTQQSPAQQAAPKPPAPEAPKHSQQQVIKGIKQKRMQNGKV